MFTCILPCLVWFKKTGYAGLGTGLCGFSLGLWPASFSFFGTALKDSLGIASSMCVAAGIITAVSLLAYVSIGTICVPKPALEIGVSPEISHTHAEIDGPTTAADGEATAEGPAQPTTAADGEATAEEPAQPSTKANGEADNQSILTQREILTSKAFLLLWFNFLFCLLPDFGVKYLIAPLLNTTFGASSGEQTTASALFLIVYAIARLVGGVLSKYVMAKLVFIGLLIMQLFGFVGSALILHEQNNVDGAMEWFIFFQSFVGFSMGANKVLFYMLSFECFGADNFPIAVGTLASSYGLAAFVGPFCSWQTLRGFVPPDQQGSFDADSPEIYFWVSAGSTLISVAFALIVRPIDSKQIVQDRAAPVLTSEVSHHQLMRQSNADLHELDSSGSGMFNG